MVAAHPLVAQAEGLAVAQAVGERPAEGTVVDAPAASAAGIPAERQAQVALQAIRGDADAPLETEEMLGVDLLQFAIVVAAGPVRGDTVVQASQVETVRLRRAGETPVAVEQRQVAGARLVALADLGQPSQVQAQSAQFAGSQQRALEHLGNSRP